MSDATKERAPTEELLHLPPTPENLHAKLDHLIIGSTLSLTASEAARDASEEACKLAKDAKEAAQKAANAALKAGQSREPLVKAERMLSLFLGAAAGSGAATALAWGMGLGAAVFASSCLGR